LTASKGFEIILQTTPETMAEAKLILAARETPIFLYDPGSCRVSGLVDAP
jgi:hypothetical protein